jgi:hypothetical protein
VAKRTSTSALRERIREALLRLEGVAESPSQFGDRHAFWVNGKEVAHFDADDAVDLRLTRKVISAHRARLKADPRVTLRRSGGDWLEVRFAHGHDVAFVAELAALAVEAHAGRASQPPPTGPALERRRRFH